MTHCILILALSQWSGTECASSLRYACIEMLLLYSSILFSHIYVCYYCYIHSHLHVINSTIHCCNYRFISLSFKEPERRKESNCILIACIILTIIFTISGFLHLILWVGITYHLVLILANISPYVPIRP